MTTSRSSWRAPPDAAARCLTPPLPDPEQPRERPADDGPLPLRGRADCRRIEFPAIERLEDQPAVVQVGPDRGVRLDRHARRRPERQPVDIRRPFQVDDLGERLSPHQVDEAGGTMWKWTSIASTDSSYLVSAARTRMGRHGVCALLP